MSSSINELKNCLIFWPFYFCFVCMSQCIKDVTTFRRPNFNQQLAITEYRIHELFGNLTILYSVLIYIENFKAYCRVHSIYRFLVKVTKNEKINCPVCLFYIWKIRILPENDSWFFPFLVTLTKKRKTKMEWTRLINQFCRNDFEY